ncbi:helicase-related protein [Thermosporothrix hazakensis]|uniref:helicase-related protein n=2 Tax=Thermosporothrix hazakensis TaxID=644383 RepID=UPI0014775E5C|nr:helicase-related protein [Thermosporothrix hazakensis]
MTGTWHVWVEKSATTTPAATSAWGTARLHAYALLEAGLNKKAPVVYDLAPDGTSVKNSEETLAAQEKLRAIEARFAEWIWDDVERARELAAIYHRTYTAWVPRHDDGAHLSFPGMSARWQTQLYPWQRDFVWRMVTSPAALCAHPVGAGKTTTEIAGAMTLRRLGLVRKPAILVPNHLLEQITAEAQQLYPGAQILMVSREELSREKRPLFAARLATGTWDLVVLTHSGFAALGVHPDTEARFLEARVTAYREALLSLEREPHEQEDRAARRSIKQLETQIERMRQRQQALQERPHDGGVTFEQLGIDYLIVDEAHLYKNLGLPSNLPALQVRPSTRACDLEMKLRWLQAHNEGRPFAAFFTATPLSNSMVEAFVWGWYLRPELLRAWGLESVDAFASCFIDFETRVEVSPNGASFRLFRRPTRFLNLPEFLALFSQFVDLRSPELLHGLRPSRIERTIVVEPDADTQAFVDTLVERCEAIQRGSPQWIAGRLDNMLWVTTHGRMAALDLSLVGERAARSPKLEAMAAQMLAVYERWQREAAFLPGAFKSLQIGFCDLGTPDAQDDKLYGTLRRLLIAGGIPAHGIRFIHEATTDQQKAHLFEQCRNGQVAILLGSTAKLGTGTNIQTRAAALHHLDAPWRPDEVEQREGRVCRPGNLYPQVELFRYVQERTFDAYSWQVLTTKAVFFDQVRAGRLSERTTEELGAHALSYGQVKAAATGDPLVLEQAEIAEVLAQLLRLQQAHRRARARDAHEAEQARAAARRTRIEAHQLAAIARQAEQAPAGLRLPSGQLLTAREEIAEFIALRVLHQLTQNKGWENLGHWQDCECAVRLRQQERRYTIDLLFGSSDSAPCVSLASTWLAQGQRWRIVEALTRFTATAAAQAERLRETAERLEARAARFAAQAAEPFARQEELHRVRARQQALDRYTHLVAEAKEQPEKAAEAAQLRASLLAESTSHTAAVTASPIPTETPAALLPPRVPATLPASEVQTASTSASQREVRTLPSPASVVPAEAHPRSPQPAVRPNASHPPKQRTRARSSTPVEQYPPAQVLTAEAAVPGEVLAERTAHPRSPQTTTRQAGSQRPGQKASRATTPASAGPRPRRRATQGAASGPAGETTPAPTTTSAQTEQRPPVIPGSRATLVFGNPEHIQQVRAASQRKPRSSRRQTEQAPTSAGAGHRAQSTPVPQQAQRSVARIRTPSSQATEHAAAAQQQHLSHRRCTDTVSTPRVSLRFGHPEHLQRLRKPSPRRSRRTSTTPAEEPPGLFTLLLTTAEDAMSNSQQMLVPSSAPVDRQGRALRRSGHASTGPLAETTLPAPSQTSDLPSASDRSHQRSHPSVCPGALVFGKPERPLRTRRRARSTQEVGGTISQCPFWTETDTEEHPTSLPPRR